MQGNFSDAQILLEQIYSTIASNGQHNISLCCDFLAARLSLFQEGVTFVKNPEVKRKELLSLHNMMWLNIFDSTYAYYYALIRMPEKIPMNLCLSTFRSRPLLLTQCWANIMMHDSFCRKP